MAEKTSIAECVCLKCGHRWWPVKPGRPVKCPSPTCRSPFYWDTPRKEKK